MIFYEEEVREKFPQLTEEEMLELKIHVLIYETAEDITSNAIRKAYAFNNKLYRSERKDVLKLIADSGRETKNKNYFKQKKAKSKYKEDKYKSKTKRKSGYERRLEKFAKFGAKQKKMIKLKLNWKF